MSDILQRLHCTIRCDIETAASGCHCAAARDEITHLRAENERLRAANETWASSYHAEYYANVRLRAALRPFAEAADGFDAARIRNPEEWFAYRGIVSATEAKGAITVGDLRRARAALDGQPAPSEWRPIEQPPSRAMRVLLFSPDQYHAEWDGADYGIRVGYFTNGQWRDQGTNHDAFEFDTPTHWAPLLLPPAPGKEVK